MIDQHVSTGRDLAPTPDARKRIDHSMDLLQYGIAILALIVAVLLAAIR